MTSSDVPFWIDVASRGGPLLALGILFYIARAFLRVDVVPRLLYEREREERMKASERADKALDVAHLANSALDKMTDARHDRP